MPQTPCTEMAPTGSSILIRSKKTIAITTMKPATRPMTIAAKLLTLAVPAVIPTSPASAPLSVMPGSGRPNTGYAHAVIIAASAPADAARVVVVTRPRRSRRRPRPASIHR